MQYGKLSDATQIQKLFFNIEHNLKSRVTLWGIASHRNFKNINVQYQDRVWKLSNYFDWSKWGESGQWFVFQVNTYNELMWTG